MSIISIMVFLLSYKFESALRQANRLDHPLRLAERFSVLRLRVGVGDDAGAGLEEDLPVPDQHRPDRDAEIHVAVVAEVPHGAAVRPPAGGLQLRDDLHRPDLRRPGQGPRREGRPEDVEAVLLRCELRLDVRDEVHDVGVALHRHQLADLDASDPGDPPEVVPAQVDEHDVLRPLLGVLQELVGEPPVLLFVLPPPPRPGDGLELRDPLLEADHDLRRGADEVHLLEAEKEQVGRGVDVAERPVEIDRVRCRNPAETAGRGPPG